MPMRVAMLAAECEPWAKTGGLADVVDALARALGQLGTAGGCRWTAPVDVFLPRYRVVPGSGGRVDPGHATVRVPDPRAPAGSSTVYDHRCRGEWLSAAARGSPAAFDRDGLYGDAAGDYADNAWRFGLFGRAALEALRADGRPVDVLHLHDWHAGPAAIYPRRPVRRRPGRRRGRRS